MPVQLYMQLLRLPQLIKQISAHLQPERVEASKVHVPLHPLFELAKEPFWICILALQNMQVK